MQLPYKLVSIMELLRLEADAYCRLMSMIGQLVAQFKIAAEAPPGIAMRVNNKTFTYLAETCGEMQRQVEQLNLPLAKRHLERMKETMTSDASAFTNEAIMRNLFELSARVIDELEDRLFLSVPTEQATLYLQTSPPFGEAVTKHFSQTIEDISEGAKCLALDRPTACVFHLMRVMELAVQRFGSELGVKLATEQNWQVILDQVNAAIRKRDPKKDKKAKAYASVASHLYNVKVAWRNEVMHPKQTYTFEEAKAVFDNVKVFMRELTTIL